MEPVVRKLAEWMLSELHQLPAPITALYVEFGESVAPDQTLKVYADLFGFERLAGGAFDPTNLDHIAELGDFVWQAEEPPYFDLADNLDRDWTHTLEAAAPCPDVERMLRSRGLQFLIGEHDGGVRVVR